MLYGAGSPFPTTSFSIWPGATVDIGDDTYVAFSAFSAHKRISIGKRVLIAAGCRILDSDGHALDSIPRLTCDGEAVGEVRIEDDVWLGCDVMVCKGVTIGRGSVIGAKSIVTHDIPPGVLAAGMPAQVIRPLRLEDKA
jgi:maltose O-acetyltransferase